ncbi:MAG TPA: hypothetical protein VMV48_13250 [Gallionellaceae bacterium]|nr:hypothetical protein [Gallionellaceae bacterium]
MNLSRSAKRLALLVVLSIFVVLLSKSLLGKAVKNLSIEAEKKQQARAAKNSAALPVSAVEVTSAVAEASSGASATEPESAPGAAGNTSAAE